MQKQRIKRNYAKEVRQAGQNTKKAAATAKSAAVRAKEAAKKVAVFVKSNWKVILIVVAIAAVVFLLLGGISSCTMMLGNGAGTVFSSSYLSEDADIHGAENAYLAMEAELQNKLDNYETLNPGYDEYRTIWTISSIGFGAEVKKCSGLDLDPLSLTFVSRKSGAKNIAAASSELLHNKFANASTM